MLVQPALPRRAVAAHQPGLGAGGVAGVAGGGLHIPLHQLAKGVGQAVAPAGLHQSRQARLQQLSTAVIALQTGEQIAAVQAVHQRGLGHLDGVLLLGLGLPG